MGVLLDLSKKLSLIMRCLILGAIYLVIFPLFSIPYLPARIGGCKNAARVWRVTLLNTKYFESMA